MGPCGVQRGFSAVRLRHAATRAHTSPGVPSMTPPGCQRPPGYPVGSVMVC